MVQKGISLSDPILRSIFCRPKVRILVSEGYFSVESSGIKSRHYVLGLQCTSLLEVPEVTAQKQTSTSVNGLEMGQLT